MGNTNKKVNLEYLPNIQYVDTMTSTSLPGHSKEIMVAQPVDTIPAAPDSTREAMQDDSGNLDAKETGMDVLSGISGDSAGRLDYSESPPAY